MGNTIKNMNNLIFPAGHGVIADNRLEECGDPAPSGKEFAESSHSNSLEMEGSDGGGWYIYNNVIRDSAQHPEVGCESASLFGGGGPIYFFNNVITESHQNGVNFEDTKAGERIYVFNNSIEGRFARGHFCLPAETR